MTLRRPVAVLFACDADIGKAEKVLAAVDGKTTMIDIALQRSRENQDLRVNVSRAVSPEALGASIDSPLPGIALMEGKLSRRGMTGTKIKNRIEEQ